MSTKLCIIRHGETAWNAEHRVQGQLDIPLNDIGLKQAQAVGRALKGERFDAVYSSDLTRARQTAAPIAALLGMDLVLEKSLRERHYGIFERLTYAEVKVRYPEDYARFEAHDPEFAFRTGESLKDFSVRSISAISSIADRHPDQSILVFTHGGVLDQFYRHVTGTPLSTQRGFGIPNAGLNRVERAAAGWQLRAWAEVAHLERALDDLPDP
jgi:probable phosphoglycerate mutase